MMRRRLVVALIAIAAPLLSVSAQAEPKPGSFGFSIEIDGEGLFLNPILKAVTIKAVVAGRPASNAGIKPGDQVIEVEGKQVVGARGRELEPLMRKNVGETLTMRLRKPGGEAYAVSLVAAEKPN